MKIMVAGERGMLARDLIPMLAEDHEVLSPGENRLDITDEKRVLDLIERTRPALVINCAAYNQVDRAETDREAAFRVNAHGVHHLAVACDKFGSTLCHFGTDYVFDGRNTRPYRPDDEAHPISVYGESKRAGEVYVESILPQRYYLIRTSSLYGRHGGNFVYTVLRLAENNEVLSIVDDQIMSPTWTVNLARGVVALIESGKFGTYHLTDKTGGGITWFQFAKEILAVKGLDNKIRPVTSEQFKRAARRPAYSVLDTTLFTQRTGYEPMPWRESLKRFLDLL